MTLQQSVEAAAVDKFGFLVSRYRFQPPSIEREWYKTSVCYLTEDTGVEIELDWVDSDVFLLLVRLEGGRLPKGYYVSGGRECRVHWTAVLTRLGIDIGNPKPKRKKKGSIPFEYYESCLDHYCLQAERSIDKVLASKQSLFHLKEGE
jgi:hypothetical protein